MEIINLDMTPSTVTPNAHAGQYDSARTVRFMLNNGGVPFTLAGTETITAEITRSDNTEVTVNVANTSSNYVDVVFDDTVCTVKGLYACELRLKDSDGFDIGSKNFALLVQRDPYDGAGIHVETVGPADICTFETTLPEPLQSVTVNVEASQASGTPTPSTPLPITGYSEANITRRGVNLFDFESWLTSKGVTYTKVGNKYTFNITGTLYTQPFVFSNVDVPVTLSGNIVNLTSIVGRLELLDVNNQLVTRLDEGRTSITGTGSKIRLNYTTSGSISIEAPQVELGSTASEYIPYNGQTYAVAFGQTVYGGVLDVTRGKLHVTRGGVDLSDTSKFNFTYDNISKRWQSPFSDIEVFAQRSADVLAEQWQADTTAAAGSEAKFFTVGGALYFYTADNVNKPEGNLVYPLKTPFDIDLTPAQINALALPDSNNVFADCGETTVKYLKAGE